MNKITKSKFMPFILMSLLTVVICAPIFTINLFTHNEALLHMSRFIAIDETIKEGIFPPIINARFMNGFGYALNLFYGPITTYIPIIIMNILGSAGLSFKVFTMLTVFISAVTMYKFVFTITNRKSISIIASLIYISAPYKLSDIYARDAIGEYTAFIFIPIVFLGLYNILSKSKKDYYLALGIIGLVLSHTITTIYIASFSFIYLLLNLNKIKRVDVWKKIIINILIAFLVCNFYAIPLLEHTFETDYALYSQRRMQTSGEDVQRTALEFKDLFANEFGTQEIRFSIGIVIILLAILSLACYKKVNKEYKKNYLDFIILSAISLFMCTELFPWKYMPQTLTVIQFAWRNLGFFVFFISFICAINAVIFAENILKKDVWRDTFLFGTIVSIFVFAFLGTYREWKFNNISKERTAGETISNLETISPLQINREYMPLKAIDNLQYVIDRNDNVYIINGEATIVSEEKNGLNYKLLLKNVKDGTVLELPYLYYLGYTVEVSYDGNIFDKVKPFESEKGFLSINVKKSTEVFINIKYEGSFVEKVSYIITIFGIILLTIYIIKDKKSEIKNEKTKK